MGLVGIYNSRRETPVFAGVTVETDPINRTVKLMSSREEVSRKLRGKGIVSVEWDLTVVALHR